MIGEPGVYDVPEADYHADTTLAENFGPSMSSTDAKHILAVTPARFRWDKDHPDTTHKNVYDFGTGVHACVLGVGGEQIVEVEEKDWRKKDARQVKEDAIAAGKTPLLSAEVEECWKIARVVHGHPVAGSILLQGKAEQSLYWRDEEHGITCRGRVDWLRDNAIVDVKTTESAARDDYAKKCFNLGYHQQAAWYVDGVAALTGVELPFIHIAVETKPPYLIAIYQFMQDEIELGREANGRAKAIYADCVERGDWPGYPEEIQELTFPLWAFK